MGYMGGLDGPPKPLALGSAAAKPRRSSIRRRGSARTGSLHPDTRPPAPRELSGLATAPALRPGYFIAAMRASSARTTLSRATGSRVARVSRLVW